VDIEEVAALAGDADVVETAVTIAVFLASFRRIDGNW
jgi:hypothetical protein